MHQAETEIDDVNIEEIMQEIRKQLLAKRAKLSPDGIPIVQIEGKRLSPEFYEHLYGAGMNHDQIQAHMLVSRISLPIIGPLIQKMRRTVHQLVLFYVNQVAANQIRVNHHLLRALSILAEDLEKAEEA